MPKIRADEELMSAVGFICRNSTQSPFRTELMNQVVRCSVGRLYDHLIKTDRDRAIADHVRMIQSQMKKRGYI